MRRMLAVAGAVWMATLVAGCGHARRVRAEAAETLDCASSKIELKEERPGVWTATGCGKAAICTLADTERAEPSCVGGGSRTPEG